MIWWGLDTALVNSGLVGMDDQGRILFRGKPYPKKQYSGDVDSLFQTHSRIHEVAAWIQSSILETQAAFGQRAHFLAMEDYLLTGMQRSYKVAELNAIMKEWCWQLKQPYCLVHPKKTLKYVVKKREVTKTEIIDYVKKRCPLLFDGIDRVDYSDIADAWVVCQIGKMAWEAMSTSDPLQYVKAHPIWESRWKELLATDESGIVTKMGLVQWSYNG